MKHVSHIEYDDKVWLNEDCKLRGICGEVEAARTTGQTALIIAYFEDTLAQLENSLQARAITYQHYSMFYLSTLCEVQPGTLITALAQDLRSSTGLTARSAQPAPPLLVIIAEHYPLLTREQDLLQVVAALPCAGQICFHSALTDPLLRRFGSASVQTLFKQLGVDEQTPLSHSLISSALRQAQAKIGKKVDVEFGTRSAVDWFKVNLPD